MKPDKEGFLYPQIDDSKCIHCKLCENTCPVINRKKERPMTQAAYIVQIKNDEVCRQSTSGGAFTAIAQEILKKGGIVYGAAYDRDFTVRHVGVRTREELARFRNSKYVQSDIVGTYQEVRKYLETDIYVCYSGTPCQIEGLRNYLDKEYERLITVDVVCRAVSSPLVWKRYLDMQKKNIKSSIGNVRFRDKKFGYKYSSMCFTDNDGKELYAMGVESDVMCRAFFSNICDRPSCYQCAFKKQYRVSDFTLWDCFHVGRFSKELDNDKGATRILVHTDKGKELFERIKNDFEYIQIDPDDAVVKSKEMFESVPYNPKRECFMKDVQDMEGRQLFEKFFPDTVKIKLERTVRRFCLKIGIYSIAKKMFVRMTGKY